MYIEILKAMFACMVIKKDASLISEYYHKDFLLYTNGQIIDYDDFYTSHVKYYVSSITYHVKYDEQTLFESGTKVAGRMWITTQKHGEAAREIEVILVAEFKDDKIYRLWELTYPDWSQLSTFQMHELSDQ